MSSIDSVPVGWTVSAVACPKQPCRLCYYETTDTVEIFSKLNTEDYPSKIRKYLYLEVLFEDDQPKTICWMCSQHLETFHKFYSKINEIQRTMLLERYASVALCPIYTLEAAKYAIIESKLEEANTYDEIVVEQESSIVEEANTYSESATEPDEALVADTSEYNTNSCPRIFDEKTGQFLEQVIEIQDDEHMYEDTSQSEPQSSTEQTIVNINPEETTERIVPPLVNTRRTRSSRQRSFDTTPIIAQDTHKDAIPKKRGRAAKSITTEDSSSKLHDIEENIESITVTTDEQSINVFVVKEDQIDETLVKRGRGRSKGSLNKPPKCSKPVVELESSPDEPEIVSSTKSESSTPPKKRVRKSRSSTASNKVLSKHRDLPMHDIDDDDEGESDNEFPARDSDNEDWPAQQTLDDFPKQIIENGLLLVKGKKLMTMICKFYKLNCDKCTENQTRFKTLRELFAHYEEEHNVVGYVDCCQTKFSRYPAIIMHMARHIQPEAFKCTVCGYMVTRPRFLQSHIQTHLPEAERPYGCEECPRRFCWKGALQIHAIQHQPAGERKLYVCHVCGKFYDTPGGLSTHKKLIHGDKKPGSNVCHVCAKKFATRTGLNEHMTTIHVPRERDQLQCNECGKWLMNQRCLKSHMVLHSAVHFNCDNCDYTTKKMILLKRHLLTQHSDEKPFSCDKCGKTFKLKRALTVHVAQHESSKTYQCTFCARVFNSSTNFYTHRKNLHPEELQEMKNRAAEAQRQKRVRAGVEVGGQTSATITSAGMKAEVTPAFGEEEEEYGEYIISDAIPDDGNEEIELIPVKENEMHELSYIEDGSMVGGGPSSVMVDENAAMLSTLIAGDYETIETCEVVTGDDGSDEHVLVNIQIGNVYEE